MKPNSQELPGKPANKVKSFFKWAMAGLPLGGIVWASFLPIQVWMQQALILVTLVWFYVFFLMDTFFLGK